MGGIITILFVYIFLGLLAKLIITPYENFVNHIADIVIEKQKDKEQCQNL